MCNRWDAINLMTVKLLLAILATTRVTAMAVDQKDVEYGHPGAKALLLDLHVPDGAGPFPAAQPTLLQITAVAKVVDRDFKIDIPVPPFTFEYGRILKFSQKCREIKGLRRRSRPVASARHAPK